MSRKDYRALAEALARANAIISFWPAPDRTRERAHGEYVKQVAGVLAHDNPRFSAKLFFRAAGARPGGGQGQASKHDTRGDGDGDFDATLQATA
jgi:hypothetical protein